MSKKASNPEPPIRANRPPPPGAPPKPEGPALRDIPENGMIAIPPMKRVPSDRNVSEDTEIRLTIEIDARLPSVPDFIVSKDGTYKWEVRKFSRNELEAIADAWKAELLKKAGKT